MKLTSSLSALASVAYLGSVACHVTANPSKGVENTYFYTGLRIPHGCDGLPTVKVFIEFDEEALKIGTGFAAEHIAGWTPTMFTAESQPKIMPRNFRRHEGGHEDHKGHEGHEGHGDQKPKDQKDQPDTQKDKPKDNSPITGVVYSGSSIDDKMFADFGVKFKVPSLDALPKERNNTLIFKVRQLCEGEKKWLNWTDISDSKFPPPTVQIIKAEKKSSGQAVLINPTITTLLLLFSLGSALLV